MYMFNGYPFLAAAIVVATLLSGCGQSKQHASLQRPPTMDVSIVVTVEYFDAGESPTVEEAPLVAEAAGNGQPPADLENPATDEIQFMAEAPADVKSKPDPDIPLADVTAVAGNIRPDALTAVNEAVPPTVETPILVEAPAGAESMADSKVPLADEVVPPAAETPVIAEISAGAEPKVGDNVALVDEAAVAMETSVAAEIRVAVPIAAALTAPDFGKGNQVFFDFDSSAIQDDQRAMILEWVNWLKAHPGWALRIEGHTDRQGSCLYNRWLGQQRANAARDILVRQGIDPNRLLAVSFGEDRPTIRGASRAERGRNRRVRAEPMRLAELENYDPDLRPCASTIMVKSKPSETANAEPVLVAGSRQTFEH